MLVAKTQIARGTVFDQALAENQFETKQIPHDSLPPNYIAAGRQRRPARVYTGKVAASDDLHRHRPRVGPVGAGLAA